MIAAAPANHAILSKMNRYVLIDQLRLVYENERMISQT